MNSAVLFLVFNRPDTTAQVFEAVRAARPPRLYVAADGPRANRQGEAARCAEVRRIATAVDWPCEVKTLFREQNLGCKMGVSGGITWFFENEEEGVILEDDVLPVPSFFPYCDELLDRYRNDDRVGMISGCNLISRHFTPKGSYFFSRYNHIWGWASWRRAWKHYDVRMSAWPAWRDGGGWTGLCAGDRLFEEYWRDIFDSAHRGDIDTWDYQWTFSCWHTGALSTLPAHNQTRNVGFGQGATHTTAEAPLFVIESIAKPLDFPLRHPIEVERQFVADTLIANRAFCVTRRSILLRRIRSAPALVWLFGKLSILRRQTDVQH